MAAFRVALPAWNFQRVSWAAAVGVLLALTVTTFSLPGGNDLYLFYLPFAQGCLSCGYVPYFAQWPLAPLAFLPAGAEWPVYVLAAALVWLGLAWVDRANPAVLLLSLPFLGELWLGQIDWVPALGLVVALRARSPYVRGLGIALMAVKPQLAWLIILALLWRDREWWRVLAVPAVVGILSLLIFGPTWPLDWLRASSGLPVHIWRIASIDIWPLGAALVWLPWLARERRARVELAALVGCIATPFVGIYAYVLPLLIARPPWWALPLSYAWLLAYPWFGADAIRFAWLLPLGLLIARLPQLKGAVRAGWTGRDRPASVDSAGHEQ